MVKITIKGVLECLDNGMSRDQIGSHYGISKSDVKRLFQHPELKGKKPRKAPGFIIVDDTDTVDPNQLELKFEEVEEENPIIMTTAEIEAIEVEAEIVHNDTQEDFTNRFDDSNY